MGYKNRKRKTNLSVRKTTVFFITPFAISVTYSLPFNFGYLSSVGSVAAKLAKLWSKKLLRTSVSFNEDLQAVVLSQSRISQNKAFRILRFY